MEITSKNLYLSRRDFLKAAGIVIGSALLAACSPQREGPNPINNEAVMLLEAELGPDWQKNVSSQLSEAIIGNDSDESSPHGLANMFVAGALAAEVATPALMEKVHFDLISLGDSGLKEVIGEANQFGKVISFYHEASKGGFVVFVPGEKSWYKFFNLPSNGGLKGYHNQALEIWKDVLRLWDIPGELKHGITTFSGKEYIFYKTPNVGEKNLSTLISANQWGSSEATNAEVKRLVLGWYRKSAEFIRDGNFAAVHWDANPTNLRYFSSDIPGGDFLAPIDFDTMPLAFDSPETAAKMLGKRVKLFYGGVLKNYETYVTEEQIAAVVNQVFGKDVWGVGINDSISSVRIRLPIKLVDGGNFGMRYFFDVDNLRGVNQKLLRQSFETILANEIPGGDLRGFAETEMVFNHGSGTKKIRMFMNAGGSSLLPIKGNNVKLAELMSAMKPYVRGAMRTLDVVAAFTVIQDIAYHQDHPYTYLDRTVLHAIETGNLEAHSSLTSFATQMVNRHKNIVTEVMTNEFGAGKLYFPFLTETIQTIEEITDIPITDKQWADFVLSEGKYKNFNLSEELKGAYAEANSWIKSQLISLVHKTGVWTRMEIDGMSAVPLLPSGAEGNLYVQLQNEYGQDLNMTFAAGRNVGESGETEIHPIFNINLTIDQDGAIQVNPEPEILESPVKMNINYGERIYELDPENVEMVKQFNNDFILEMLFKSEYSLNNQKNSP